MAAQNIIPIAYMPVARIGEVDNAHLWQNEAFNTICQKYSKSQA